MAEKVVPPQSADLYRPGLHSHSVTRLTRERLPPQVPFRRIKLVLISIGVLCLAYWGYSLGDQYVYQAYENWAFDQQIAGRSAVNFADYVRQDTPFGFLFGRKALTSVSTSKSVSSQSVSETSDTDSTDSKGIQNRPAEGDLLGRVSVSRLNLSAMVREGVSDTTLSVAVGHIPATALPGQPGNFVLAAHRDTLFRALKDIHIHDLVNIQLASGSFDYQVLATRIVKPSDVSVLRSDGGGLIPASVSTSDGKPERLVTLITCYPFRYVGSAPKRFIVEGRLVSNDRPASSQPENVVSDKPLAVSQVRHTPAPRSTHIGIRHKRLATKGQQAMPEGRASIVKPVQKRNWWQRIFHPQ